MPTFSPRGCLLRPHLKAVRIPPRGFGRANIRQVSRRQQSSATPLPSSSSSSSSSSLPNANHPPESAARAPVPTQPAPQITQHVTAQAISETNIDPSPSPIPIPVANVVAPLPFWQLLGPLTRAGQAYSRAQRTRPWATQVASALLIYLLADFGAQRLGSGGIGNRADNEDDEAAGRRHDWARTARSLTIGGTAAIPSFIWFAFLSRSFNYSSRVLSIAVKVTVSQLVFAPLFSVYFFGSQALLSGDSPGEAWRRVCHTVPVSFINSCKLWPAVTAFSFAVVPFEYRSLFAGAVGVCWQTYLSFLNGRAERLEALRQNEEGGEEGKERHAVSLEEGTSVPTLTTVRDLPPAANQAVLA
ncbi:hypothetical protein F5B18DRAFT_629762 [Nemania serpens]|nr:hypothetical protein F5B18DRAFT_629762 [Nemania serpens]